MDIKVQRVVKSSSPGFVASVSLPLDASLGDLRNAVAKVPEFSDLDVIKTAKFCHLGKILQGDDKLLVGDFSVKNGDCLPMVVKEKPPPPPQPEASTIHVTVQFQDQVLSNIEVDLNDPLAVFKYQLFSMTDVAPEDQVIVGVKGELKKDDASMQSLGMTNGSKYILTMRKVFEQAAASSSVVVEERVREEDIQQCCTECSRIFFQAEDVHQPTFAVAGGLKVCLACAQTCHPWGKAAAVKSDKVRCRCAEVGECLFYPRVQFGAETASGKLKEMMLQRLNKAAADIDAQFLAKETSQNPEQMRMFGRLRSNQQQVMQYEDARLQAKALALLPPDMMQKAADLSREHSSNVRIEIAKLLLDWYKHQFFKWANSPECSRCKTSTQCIGATAPNPEEAAYLAGNVEIYKCNTCGGITRFPRYNHVEKLLETRVGRCGEWVQGFMLFARALKFDSRMVHDWTDHVWVELWISNDDSGNADGNIHGRWVHADPCEAALDAPLMYESGWGKKLTYVIANSCEEIVDVSRRYTNDYTAMLQRRNLVSEEWLSRSISTLDSLQQSMIPYTRRDIIRRRRTAEEAFLRSRVASSNEAREISAAEQLPRQSGSLSWRSGRGELGGAAAELKQKEGSDEKAAIVAFVSGLIDPKDIPDAKDWNKVICCSEFAEQTLTGMKLFGSACRTCDRELQLTTDQPKQSGAAWLQQPVHISSDFVLRIVFKVVGHGGEGFGVVLSAADPSLGQSRGYGGLKRCVVVDVDIQNATENKEKKLSMLRVLSGGPDMETSNDESNMVENAEISEDKLTNDMPHALLISYVQQQLNVYFDDMSAPILSTTVDLKTMLTLDPAISQFHVGITAATSQQSGQTHSILAFSLDRK